jgi:hypothetical protein
MTTIDASPSRYFLQVRIPGPAFTAALRTVADREMLSVSDYVRLVLFEKLRAAGIDPAKLVNADSKPSRQGQEDARI